MRKTTDVFEHACPLQMAKLVFFRLHEASMAKKCGNKTRWEVICRLHYRRRPQWLLVVQAPTAAVHSSLRLWRKSCPIFSVSTLRGHWRIQIRVIYAHTGLLLPFLPTCAQDISPSKSVWQPPENRSEKKARPSLDWNTRAWGDATNEMTWDVFIQELLLLIFDLAVCH